MLELWEKNKFWEISQGALNENIVQIKLSFAERILIFKRYI